MSLYESVMAWRGHPAEELWAFSLSRTSRDERDRILEELAENAILEIDRISLSGD